MPDSTVSTNSSREVRERLSRCVSTMVYYQADGWSWSGVQLLFEEVGALKSWAARHVPGDGLRSAIIDPLEAELTDRFGEAAGRKLHREFLRAYKLATEGQLDDGEPAYARHFRPRAQ